MDVSLPTRLGTMRGEQDGGPGPADVVLLHASLHDRRDWDPIVPALAAHHRVLRLDWPGHGTSDPVPPMRLSAPALADALEDATADLAAPVHLVGNSVGGYAAARLAVRRPDRVRSLTLVNAGGFERHTPFTRAFCATMGRPGVSRRAMAGFARAYLRTRTDADRAVLARVTARARTPEGAATVAALWRSFPDPAHDLRVAAPGITAPTLVVWGTRDVAIPTSSGRRAAALIPGATWVPLRTGHLPFSSDPAGFLAALEPHLAAS